MPRNTRIPCRAYNAVKITQLKQPERRVSDCTPVQPPAPDRADRPGFRLLTELALRPTVSTLLQGVLADADCAALVRCPL